MIALGVRIAGWRVVVAGGGAVAERKVLRLVRDGAEVTVVSPRLTAALSEAAAQGRIEWIAREVMAEDYAGARLVLLCTDNADVNATHARHARAAGALVNRADNAEDCDFVLPYPIEHGALKIALFTGGLAPAVARRLREQIEGMLGDDFEATLDAFAAVRAEILERTELTQPERSELVHAVLEAGFLDVCRDEGVDAGRALATRVLSER